MKHSLYCIVFLGLLVGCTTPATVPAETGYDFFPLEEGYYHQYDVTETRYTLARPAEITSYSIRETIGKKYTDADGQDVYRIERAVLRGNQWRVDSVWTAWLTTDRALRVENGNTFVKLEFPIRKDASWDGNRFNSLNEQMYRVVTLDSTMKVGTDVFEKTLIVEQENTSTLLSVRRTRELYAKGIGLIGRERTNFTYCATPDCLGKGIIDYGFSQQVIITKYGK